MFKAIMDSVEYPTWADDRYKRLDMLDRVLDGTLYDHLEYDFYTETKNNHAQEYIPIQQRRPSVQSAFAQQIVGALARKLFSGKHAPRITHDSEEYAAVIREVIARGSVFDRMAEAVFFGSVGAVGITFRIVDNALNLDVWRPKYCHPVFNASGGLASLRVCYTVGGREARSVFSPRGVTKDSEGEELDDSDSYWFIREFTDNAEVTYMPYPSDEWNPVEYGWDLEPAFEVHHGLGFVPGVWIENMPGGIGVDGRSSFSPIVNNIIEMDYTISQLGRGIRYSAAPQLVVIGDTDVQDVRRGPTTVIRLKAAYADDGQKYGAADAKLLEMVGNGTQVGLNYIQELRRITFEAMAASVKKSDMKVNVSGRAMEISDDAFYDFANMLRNSYGDGGLVPLMSKVMLAFKRTGMMPLAVGDDEITAFGLRWPKLYPSTPADDLQMVESLVMAVQNGLMEMEVAQSFLHAQMDLEDYRVPTPPQVGGTSNADAPSAGDATVKDDVYNEGVTIDPRRPGTQGTSLPKRRRVGGKKTVIE